MTREGSPEAVVRLGRLEQRRGGRVVVTPPLFPSLSPSRVKHSLEGQRRDVQLVPAGLHAEAASMRPRPSTDAPFVAALIVSQSDGQTQDARTARLAGEADAEWGLGCGGRGGGLSPPRGGAPSPAPTRRPSLAGKIGLREAGGIGATFSQEGPARVTELHSRKGRAVTAFSTGFIAPSTGPAPFRLRQGARPAPPSKGGRLLTRVGACPAPIFPLATAAGAQPHVPSHPPPVSASPGTPEAPTTPPGLCFPGFPLPGPSLPSFISEFSPISLPNISGPPAFRAPASLLPSPDSRKSGVVCAWPQRPRNPG